MRYMVMATLLILLAAAQSSVVPLGRLYSGQPSFTLLVVTAWALDATWNESIFWAFMGGLCQDLLSIAPLGTAILPLIVTVFAIRIVQQQFEGLTFLMYLVVILIGTLIAHLILFILLGVTGYAIDLVPTVRYFVLPTLAWQLLSALPVYLFTRWLNRRLTPRRVTL